MSDKERMALLIIDVQKDFCPGGSLGVPEGDQVVSVLNKYTSQFSLDSEMILFSRDWHPIDAKSHFETWPAHCVQKTNGARFHKDLLGFSDSIIITKGTELDDDHYSAFDGCTKHGIPLGEYLEVNKITTLIVGGLATDYCVLETVVDAIEKFGLKVKVIEAGIRAVNIKPGDGDAAIERMKKLGAEFI